MYEKIDVISRELFDMLKIEYQELYIYCEKCGYYRLEEMVECPCYLRKFGK